MILLRRWTRPVREFLAYYRYVRRCNTVPVALYCAAHLYRGSRR